MRLLQMVEPFCLQEGQCNEKLLNLFVSFTRDRRSVIMAIDGEGCSSTLNSCEWQMVS